MLRATTACAFSISQLPKVVREWCVLYILTSKCASRHNGVHFFDISTSKSGPSMVCFVHFEFKMCFAPQQRANFHLSSGQLAPHPPLSRAYFSTLRSHKSLEKHSVSRLSYLFAHLHLLSSDSFSSDLLSSNLSLLSASALLCFSSVHIVGSLTSKLPSAIGTLNLKGFVPTCSRACSVPVCSMTSGKCTSMVLFRSNFFRVSRVSISMLLTFSNGCWQYAFCKL